MKRIVLFVAATLAATAALADRIPVPADAPPAFKTECGSCHLAFPPALLSAADWRNVMARLDKHYGDNAALDEPTRRQIEDFLVRHAGSGRRIEGAGTSAAVLPRLTLTNWFRHKHDEVATAVWKDKRVGSAANCAACHTRAEAGSFSEREIRMPGAAGGRHHEHD
jgi:hypothetical protein